jgi:hypothetical protein
VSWVQTSHSAIWPARSASMRPVAVANPRNASHPVDRASRRRSGDRCT